MTPQEILDAQEELIAELASLNARIELLENAAHTLSTEAIDFNGRMHDFNQRFLDEGIDR